MASYLFVLNIYGILEGIVHHHVTKGALFVIQDSSLASKLINDWINK